LTFINLIATINFLIILYVLHLQFWMVVYYKYFLILDYPTATTKFNLKNLFKLN